MQFGDQRCNKFLSSTYEEEIVAQAVHKQIHVNFPDRF